ncbi:hypothetical protein PM082_022703 [Marasmius tenuissimus]|nr:hypothetical protein PM082_022702 [Marasmius tenuissimus]KAJ8096045.1 hypothetical protein PM082_022703 [Marasmius tenuissimus]
MPPDKLFRAELLLNAATPHRHPLLPVFYKVNGPHPLRPDKLKDLGNDYVFPFHSCDEVYSQAVINACKSRTIGVPKGPDKDMDARGLYELAAGDMVWVCDLDAPDVSPETDEPQVYVRHP